MLWKCFTGHYHVRLFLLLLFFFSFFGGGGGSSMSSTENKTRLQNISRVLNFRNLKQKVSCFAGIGDLFTKSNTYLQSSFWKVCNASCKVNG